MRIIDATDVHINGIIGLWREFIEYHEKIDQIFTICEDAPLKFRSYLIDSIESENSYVQVGLENDEVVAYSISRITNHPPVFEIMPRGEIIELAVRSDLQKRGIGRKMLLNIISWFEERKIKRIELRVAVKNKIGYNFWQRNGFKDYLHVLYLDLK